MKFVNKMSFPRGRILFLPSFARQALKSRTLSTVDVTEVHKFAKLSNSWGNENGPFKALHSLNQLRVPWILENLENPVSKHVVDIGSGGGLLSVPLARAGLNVTGIDATLEAVNAARYILSTAPLKETELSKRIQYECITVEELANTHKNRFDAVIASEILEHVNELESFVSAAVKIARPGAPLFFTTINKTLVSRVLAIWLAEDVLGLVPKGVHDWNKFVSPEYLSSLLTSLNCTVRSTQGFTYHPLGNRWEWINSSMCNYALMAVKNA